ncbi:MAG TPA: hypothetical protein PKW24_08130, partial [Clostridiales bacterium]|nr:hypothetical protein [Clostridiales bacterium]
MLRVNEVKLPLEGGEKEIFDAVAKTLKLPRRLIRDVRTVRQSVDSRDKNDVHFVLNLDVEVDTNEEALLKKFQSSKVFKTPEVTFPAPEIRRKSPLRPVVVGFGPAGMFAALELAKAGFAPLVFERGKKVEERARDISDFWRKRVLIESSNVQFGEGGAGTFSDGKLNTGIKNVLCRKVLEELVENGAPPEILYSAKPHVGTDKLQKVVKSVREKVIGLGGEIFFESRVEKLIIANGFVHGLTFSDKQGRLHDLETDAIILATGHSARDTVEALYAQGIKIMQKPFSVGARIEHPREVIDQAQYGPFAGHPALGAAEYKLSCHPKHGRGAYTFCMCPGGTVVAAASEKGGVVVNGMSTHARNGPNSNSALLVGIEPADLPSDHPLAGLGLQRQMEEKAFALGGSDYTAPAQLVGDFLADRPSEKLGAVSPSYP